MLNKIKKLPKSDLEIIKQILLSEKYNVKAHHLPRRAKETEYERRLDNIMKALAFI